MTSNIQGENHADKLLPKISIVIPVFNNANHVARCLESVLQQDGVQLDVVVVDDGSTDDSLRIIRNFEKHCRILTQANGGACKARNTGLSHATGEMVKFLDADDYLATGCLKLQFQQLLKLQSERLSVYGDVEWLDVQGAVTNVSGALGCDTLREGSGEVSFPLTSAPLHFTKNVRRVNGFDPRLPRAQEFDLHMRMWLDGSDFKYQPGVVYYYQQHEGLRVSSADQREATYKTRLDAYLRYLDAAIDLHPDIMENFSAGVARNIWSMGRLAVRNGIDNTIVDQMFNEAQRLSGRNAVAGSFVYRLLNMLFGARTAEKIAACLR